MRTSDTRERFVASVAEHPSWWASEHARALDISRERVRQLCAELGVTLPRKPVKPAYQRRTHCKRGHDLHGGTRCFECWDTNQKRAVARWQAANPEQLRAYRAAWIAKRKVSA